MNKKYTTKIVLSLLFVLSIFSSIPANAAITFQIVTDDLLVAPHFNNRVPEGAFPGDISWQGGSSDAVLTTLPGITTATPGRNTLGTSSRGIATLLDGTAVNSSFARGTSTYGNGIFFNPRNAGQPGEPTRVFSPLTDVNQEVEILGFGPSSSGNTRLLGDNQALFFSEDNFFRNGAVTANNDFFFSPSGQTPVRNSYYILNGQDPEVVFENLVNEVPGYFTPDGVLLANTYPFVTQQGIVDQFNFLLDNLIRDDWTLLTYEVLWLTGRDINTNADVFEFFAYGISNITFDELSFTPIPLPPAVWLFGTALLGFAGISRRRKFK
ncbi:MAG: VPLPA-CTERM sorting domain-containing protein [Pseudomonadota bacterium]